MKRKIVHIFGQNLKLYVLNGYIRGGSGTNTCIHITHNETIFGMGVLITVVGLEKD